VMNQTFLPDIAENATRARAVDYGGVRGNNG